MTTTTTTPAMHNNNTRREKIKLTGLHSAGSIPDNKSGGGCNDTTQPGAKTRGSINIPNKLCLQNEEGSNSNLEAGITNKSLQILGVKLKTSDPNSASVDCAEQLNQLWSIIVPTCVVKQTCLTSHVGPSAAVA